MSHLSLGLLGAFHAQVNNQLLTGFQSDKARALLAYLAVETRPHTRSYLAGLFWPEWPDAIARTYLRHALANLRQILGDSVTPQPFLLVTRDTLQFNVHSGHTIDVTDLSTGLARCLPAKKQVLDAETVPCLQTAVAHYHSPFLTGFFLNGCAAFEEWVLLMRENLQRQVMDALRILADHLEQVSDYEGARLYAQRRVELEPWLEEAHRQLMRLLACSGQRSAALAQYESCRRLLAAELGVAPSAETVALYEQIRDDRFDAGIGGHGNAANGSQLRSHPVTLSPAHNLPAQMTAFIGRDGECAALETLLRQPEVRLVTLTGSGGVGKTRLALQVAAELLHDFSDGVYFVALAPVRDPTLVLAAIAQTVGVRESGSRPLLESVKQHLHVKQMLLVVDNFEHLLSAASLLGELLRDCARLKFLATSRALLHLYGEYDFAVFPLPVPSLLQTALKALAEYASVQLFDQRARAAKSTFTLANENIRSVAAICVRLDGLPLAIELAAARIKLFSPQALWQRLTASDGQSPLHFLQNSTRDAPGRHQSLWHTIDWSYHLLNPAEQALFRRLAVFVGGCTLPAAKAVARPATDRKVQGASEASCLDLLASLVDKNLVYQIAQADGEPRFMLLETMREYSLERLQESGELARVQQLHADYFLKIAEAAEPHLTSVDQDRWLDQLELEHDNLRTVLDWVMRTNQAEFGLRLGNVLSPFWIRRNHHREGGQRLIQLVSLPGSQQPSSVLAGVLFSIAILASYGDDLEQEQTFFERSLQVARQIDDQHRMAYALVLLGDIAYDEGDYAKSDILHEEGIALHRAVGDIRGLATMLSHRGDKLAKRGIFLNALSLAEEGLALHRKLGDKWLLGISLRCLGNVCRLEGDYTTADTLFQETLAVAQALRHKAGITFAQFFLGALALEQHRLHDAVDWLRQSLSTMHETGYRARHGDVLDLFARLAFAQNQPARALRLAGAAAAFRGARKWKLPPVYQAQFDQMLLLARQTLPEDVAATAWAAGEAMTLDEAVAYALAG